MNTVNTLYYAFTLFRDLAVLYQIAQIYYRERGTFILFANKNELSIKNIMTYNMILYNI